jgi:hypothetical protein
MIYRRLPGPSLWQKALIDLMLKEMKSHILEAVGNRPNLMKPASELGARSYEERFRRVDQ